MKSDYFLDDYNHERFIQLCKDEINKSKELFIYHYQKTYHQPNLPPCWTIAEILSNGTWSILYKNLKNRQDKKQISDHFNLSPITFTSWLHSLSYLRNLCAHHQRLWNRQFTLGPSDIANKVRSLRSPKRYGAQAIVIDKLMSIINPSLQWRQQLFDLVKQHPTIDIKILGFGSDWQSDSSWLIKS
jgi:abortive infection bacteriophage resistance protein